VSITVNREEASDQQDGDRNIAKLTNATSIKMNNGYFHNYNIKSNQYLDIPAISSEYLKIMYNEFINGKSPVEIIAGHGYHPDSIEIEYHRFIQLRDRDVDVHLKRIVKECGTEPLGELKCLIDRYHTKGYLTNDEIDKLLKLKFERERQIRLDQLTFDTDEPLPKGAVRLTCIVCKNPIPEVILDENPDIGKSIINNYSNIRCYFCNLKN
jgi:hypothetical protein